MPTSGAPTVHLTTEAAEGLSEAPLASALMGPGYAPAVGLTAKMARAREQLCVCREHLRRASDGSQGFRQLLAQLDGLIELGGAIANWDRSLGGALAAIAHNQRAQVAHALADLAQGAEELASAEDVTLAEILTDALSFALHRLGDQHYVLSARSAMSASLDSLRATMEAELAGLLEQRSLPQHEATARGFCETLFRTSRRPEQMGPMALLVLVAIFRAKCALFVERLDALLQEKHSGPGK